MDSPLPEELAASGARVLVIAPHPDDDALGCGGVIARARDGGATVRIVYVTDGSRSHRGSRAWSPRRLRSLREGEAAAGAAALGVPAAELRFLRRPDSRLPHDARGQARLARRLAAEFAAFAPTVVLAPWIRDPHGDHVAAARATRAALPRATALLEYGVWLPERGAAADAPRPGEAEPVACDVRAALARKRDAIAAHRSQLGAVVTDARSAFVIPQGMIDRACDGTETLWRVPAGAR